MKEKILNADQQKALTHLVNSWDNGEILDENEWKNLHKKTRLDLKEVCLFHFLSTISHLLTAKSRHFVCEKILVLFLLD